jgi:hypothetical protein
MAQNMLRLLGYSAGFAFVLLIGSAVQAEPIAPPSASLVPVIPATQSAVQVGREVVFEAPQPNPQFISIDPNSDTAGDLAIAQFKCDCMGCRNAVTRMIQSGRLSL